MRVRGTIERVEGDTYIVKARNGDELKVKLAEKATVVGAGQGDAGRHQAGTYVGVAGMPQADGSQKALEVHHLPRGHARRRRRTPRLGPAAVEHHDQRQRRADPPCPADGQVLTLKYKDGEKKIVVPAGRTHRFLRAAATRSELKPARRSSSPPR